MKFNFEVLPYLIKEPTTIYAELFNRKETYPLASIGRDSYIWRGLINSGLEFTIDIGYTTHNIQIGSFNSLAEGIEFCMGINHVYTNLCMGVSKLLEANEKDDSNVSQHNQKGQFIIKNNLSSYNQKGQIVIQNDVWIGHKCTIMPGITIHNGAVIAANSHVVSDVPPYAIVGGNPAKVIKYRFNEDIIDKLLTIQWWNWSNEEIENNKKYFNQDVAKFCDTFYEKYKKEKDNIVEYNIHKLKHNFLFFVDFTEHYNIYERVVEQFINKYKNSSDHQLILFINENFAKDNSDLIDTFYKSVEDQSKKMKALCTLNICIDDASKSRSLFKTVDYYITSRAKETVLYTGYADEFNVKLISGVDTFIFH